jgi:hypothetical protein
VTADPVLRQQLDWTQTQIKVAEALRDYRLTTYVAAIRSAPNYDPEHHEPQLKQQAQEASLDWEQAKAVLDAIWPLIEAWGDARAADNRELLIEADSICSLILHRESSNLTERTYEDLANLCTKLRKANDGR